MRGRKLPKTFLAFFLFLLFSVLIASPEFHAQSSVPALSAPQQPSVPTTGKISDSDRQRALAILSDVSKIVQDHYYDPKMKGINWEANIADAKTKIIASDSMNEALGHVASAVGALNDSHTVFYPPVHTVKVDYGLQYQMIWNRCYITRVRPGSDAEAKRLRPGDEILSFNGFTPSRDNLWAIQYLYTVLRPQPGFRLEIETPSGEKKQVDSLAKVTLASDLGYQPGASVRFDLIRKDENLDHQMRIQLAVLDDVGLVRFPWFFYEGEDIYQLYRKIKDLSGVVIDLRGNPGGDVETLKYFAGMFFDHDVKLADQVMRKKTESQTIKCLKHMQYRGKVIVLVDSKSSSAAELFARIIQLEKRGTVMGDKSAGLVMESESYWYSSMGLDYYVNVTVANLIMADGKSLEHVGVTPDEYAFPHSDDLAAGRDPVLAKAAAKLGASLSSDAAGKVFQYDWPSD